MRVGNGNSSLPIGQTPIAATEKGGGLAIRQLIVEQLEATNDAQTPVGEAPRLLLTNVLEQLGWAFTKENLELLQQLLAGKSVAAPSLSNEDSSTEPCPLNRALIEELLPGWPGVFQAVFMAVDPFPVGFFLAPEREAVETEEQLSGSLTWTRGWMLSANFPALGQVDLLGQGEWPRQRLSFVARKETAELLQKKEQELRSLLIMSGMQVDAMIFAVSNKPAVSLIEADLLRIPRLNRLL